MKRYTDKKEVKVVVNQQGGQRRRRSRSRSASQTRRSGRRNNSSNARKPIARTAKPPPRPSVKHVMKKEEAKIAKAVVRAETPRRTRPAQPALPANAPLFMNVMLPAEAPLIPLPRAEDSRATNRREALVSRSIDVRPYDFSALSLFLSGLNLATSQPTLPGKKPLWVFENGAFPFIHLQDPRVWMIVPTPAWSSPSTPGTVVYTTSTLGNLPEENWLTEFNDSVPGIQVPSCNFATNADIVVNNVQQSQRRHEAFEVLEPNDTFTVETEAVMADQWFKMTDMHYEETASTGVASPPPYGTTHPVMHFKYGSEVISAIWIDAGKTVDRITAMRFTFDCQAVIGQPYTTTIWFKAYSPQQTPYKDINATAAIEAFRVAYSANNTRLVSCGHSTIPAPGYVTSGDNPAVFTIAISSSGYYAFKWTGTAIMVTSGPTPPTEWTPPVGLALTMVSQELTTYSSICSRHYVNPRLVYSSEAASLGENEASTTPYEIIQVGTAIKFTNTTPAIALGGSVTAARFDQQCLWYDKTTLGVTAITSGPSDGEENFVNMSLKNGFYSTIRPGDYPRYRRAAYLYPSISGNVNSDVVQAVSCITNLDNGMGLTFNLMYFTPPTISQADNTSTTISVTNTQIYNFTSLSQQWGAGARVVPVWRDPQVQAFMRELSKHPTFAENPSHFFEIMQRLWNGAKMAGRRAGPVLSGIGSVLSSIGDPRASAIGYGLQTAGGLGTYLGSMD